MEPKFVNTEKGLILIYSPILVNEHSSAPRHKPKANLLSWIGLLQMKGMIAITLFEFYLKRKTGSPNQHNNTGSRYSAS